MQDFFLWWSVVTTILSLIFLGVSIWQIVEGRKQKERSNAQVKIWMQDAAGVSQGLQRIIRDNIDKRYSTTDDISNAIWALQACAFSIYQSLYEERAVTEKEFKERQQRLEEEARALQQNNPQSENIGGTGTTAGATKTPKPAATPKKKARKN